MIKRALYGVAFALAATFCAVGLVLAALRITSAIAHTIWG